MTQNNIIEVEKIIGYEFKDKNLLLQALTHSSYAFEKKSTSYQNLEFLGDSILDFVVAEHLIKLYPDAAEGELTSRRAGAVAKEPLADVIDHANIDDYILTGGKTNPSVKTRSDVFEAIVAAIYYDGGMAKSRNFIIKFLGGLMKGMRIDTDYKSRLIELCTKKGLILDFVMKDITGPDHKPMFYYEAVINGEVKGYGEDLSKKAAQQEAARHAIKKIQ